MDQQEWSRVYTDLDQHIESMVRRGGTRNVDPEIFLQIDRVRFAMDRGDTARALIFLRELKERLAREAADGATRSGGGNEPAIERLDGIEEVLARELRLGSAEVPDDAEPDPASEARRAASANRVVNPSIKFEEIRDEYEEMWQSAKLRQDKLNDIRWYSKKLEDNREVYQAVSRETRVPWYFVGMLHAMECGFSLKKHLHNGDPLTARTKLVPAGRPKDGRPPFTFEESACDALEMKGYCDRDDWEIAAILFRLERYNGFGYRKKRMASPYLWNYSNHFLKGKYVADGVFDPDAPSKQCGAAVMLKDLIERGVVELGKPELIHVPAPQPAQPAPAPQPQPAPGPAPPPAPAVATGPATAPAAPAPAVPPTPAPTAAPPAPAPVGAPAQPPRPTAPATPATPAGVSPAVAAALNQLAGASTPQPAAASAPAASPPSPPSPAPQPAPAAAPAPQPLASALAALAAAAAATSSAGAEGAKPKPADEQVATGENPLASEPIPDRSKRS